MKYQSFKKRLLTESIVIGAIMIVLIAGVFYISMLSDDYEQDSAKLQREVNSTRQETTSLRNKYLNVQQNAALYDEVVKKNKAHQLTISRQVMHDAFSRFKDQYYINNFRVALSSVEERKEPQYKQPTASLVSSNVSTDFDAMSDEYVYGLIDSILHDFSGSSRITALKLTRSENMTNEILTQISQRGSYPLVKGQVKFIWLGMKTAGADADKAKP